MRNPAAILALVLGLTFLAAPPASAGAAASAENWASGSPAAANNVIEIDARLSEDAVRENIALGYDIASDDAVAARAVTNPVPAELGRVVAGNRSLTTLGRAGADDVFVVAADDIAGMNAAQISQRLSIGASDTFTVIRFPTPASGVASPVFRTNPGFLQGGLTRGGAREFVIPNGPIPAGARTTVVGP